MVAAPLVRQFATEASAEWRRQMHPGRVRRWAVSDLNPLVSPLPAVAETVRAQRRPAAKDNPFLAFERSWADGVEHAFDMWRDWRDAAMELTFHALYGTLAATGIGGGDDAGDADAARAATSAPGAAQLEAAAQQVAAGAYPEAVIRMMIVLADARGGVRRSRLARSNQVLTTEAPFAGMTPAARQEIIREQTAIVALDREAALAALPRLLPDVEDRRKALAVVEAVAGPKDDLGEKAREMLDRLRTILLS